MFVPIGMVSFVLIRWAEGREEKYFRYGWSLSLIELELDGRAKRRVREGKGSVRVDLVGLWTRAGHADGDGFLTLVNTWVEGRERLVLKPYIIKACIMQPQVIKGGY